MALCESSNWKMRGQKALLKVVVFISANIFGAVGTNCNVAIQSHNENGSMTFQTYLAPVLGAF